MSARRIVACCAAWAFHAAAAPPAAAPQPQLDAGFWRLNVSSTTNGQADADQQEDVCLGEAELKDVARYFAPVLEGIPARCTTTRQPGGDRNTIKHRMSCKGTNFTMEIRSSVVIDGAQRFRLDVRTDTRTPRESAVVLTKAHAVRTGDCPQK